MAETYKIKQFGITDEYVNYIELHWTSLHQSFVKLHGFVHYVIKFIVKFPVVSILLEMST